MTRLLRFIPVLFLALPLIEIALFIVVGRAIGVFPTLGLIVLAVIVEFRHGCMCVSTE